MPRSSTVLNETALAYDALFQVDGDRQSLERCIDYFQQAVDLQPSDPILLFNAGVTLLDGAMADVIGGEIDLRALRKSGSVQLLGDLYRDRAGRDALARRVKEHPGVARAVSYLDKVTVLSPKNGNAFESLYEVHRFTRDEPALRALEGRAGRPTWTTPTSLPTRRTSAAGPRTRTSSSGSTRP